jgi:hypothetical protein
MIWNQAPLSIIMYDIQSVTKKTLRAADMIIFAQKQKGYS